MPHLKIKFSEEAHKFMLDYKEAHGVPMQRFIEVAVDDKILNIKAEQVLKDMPLTEDKNK